ncbi:restriction endonuclease subunit S [Streptomyces sp. NPDC005438]|uniref:restriction endonuclease subunit S n=1 Tax=Streptomyces sp. NPDC005438 TaxID=3156880 RepID=UPI0033B869FE
MSADWRTVPLGKVVALQRGFDLSSDQRSPGPVPVVGASGIIGRHNQAMVRGGGITIGRAGAMGVVTRVRESFWPLNTTLFVTDFYGNDPGFVYYFLKYFDFTPYNSGGVQPMLNRNYIKDVPVRIPSHATQRAIAEVLGALDDKLSANEKLATNSIELGRTLLKNSTQAEHEEARVGDFAILVYGKSLPEPKRHAGAVPVFGCTGQVGWHNASLIEKPCPVVGRKGANAGHVSWMPEGGWIIDTAYYACATNPDISADALYFILDAAGLKSLLGDSAVPGVNRNHALALRTRIPGPENMRRFNYHSRELLAISVHAKEENRTLAELRDTLLPQLVAGKIRVKVAERMVEDAT